MVGEQCVLINRTTKPLTIQQNGRQMVLKPGRNHSTTDWIRFAKQQHPRMGTFGPSGMDGEYLVAVEGHDSADQCAPIEEGHEHRSIERFDRTQMTGDAAEAVPLGTGVTPPMRRVPGEGMAPDADAAIFSGRTDR